MHSFRKSADLKNNITTSGPLANKGKACVASVRIYTFINSQVQFLLYFNASYTLAGNNFQKLRSYAQLIDKLNFVFGIYCCTICISVESFQSYHTTTKKKEELFDTHRKWPLSELATKYEIDPLQVLFFLKARWWLLTHSNLLGRFFFLSFFYYYFL